MRVAAGSMPLEEKEGSGDRHCGLRRFWPALLVLFRARGWEA